MHSADPNRYDARMPYRRCGDSGLLLPEISLGCWHNFGHVDDQHEARAILRRAFDRGITHFDLANNYGPPPGSAEENVGRILAEDFAAHRDELLISTKAGHEMWRGPYGEWGSRKHLLASLDQSLKRLRLDYVDIFYSHRPDPNTRLEETMSALATAVHSGRALYVGLSKYPLKALKKAVRILKDMGVPCTIYQPPYSILNRWPEAEGIHDWLEEKGIGSVVFSPLAQGMLSGKYIDTIPDGSRAARSDGFLQASQVTAQLEKIRALHQIASERGISLQHLALRWVLDHSSVTSAIIGARNVTQLDDSLAALQAPKLDVETLALIDAISPALKKDDAEA
ncbi:MAG: L-glyceraldehyde 3-phosphate reductase [Verrucomicrobia bacterium]|nr:MAG: L-glyceraldehyde 3-phosphate reductase [Verrucomicrobiota bacterium]TAE89109.1 MAG: L-glyceraldehyde 3-phosphate reductase [Verrucomicrobiota bacterium]TAF28018.1 MAG: L-glyceraldehyde 3-phosphate reductase [Verrucomicrobiota bacterium]TAF42865.1 MAG: L-glyceraldehyde 3-phosphate reductase [Verrucomicrobiota bacterium]